MGARFDPDQVSYGAIVGFAELIEVITDEEVSDRTSGRKWPNDHSRFGTRRRGVKPQSMGTAIAQLEELGLIEKKPRKDEGRQIDIKVIAKTLSMRKTSHDASRSWLSQSISQLSRADQATLFEVGQIIKRMVNS
jgi:hypothetical protein